MSLRPKLLTALIVLSLAGGLPGCAGWSSMLAGKQHEDADICLETARQLDRGGHPREAALLYERARQEGSDAADIDWRLAVLYDIHGDPVLARSEFRKALAATPDNLDLLNDYGVFLHRQGDYAEAEKLLRKALASSPDNARAWTNLGVTLAAQNRYEDSFQAFAKASGPAAAHANLATILIRQGKTAEAEQACRRALSLNPKLSQPEALLAEIESRKSRPDAAVR